MDSDGWLDYDLAFAGSVAVHTFGAYAFCDSLQRLAWFYPYSVAFTAIRLGGVWLASAAAGEALRSVELAHSFVRILLANLVALGAMAEACTYLYVFEACGPTDEEPAPYCGLPRAGWLVAALAALLAAYGGVVFAAEKTMARARPSSETPLM
jgi:hypothetical protein